MRNKYINGTIKAIFFVCFFSLVSCAENNKSNITKGDLVEKISDKIPNHPEYKDNKILTKGFQQRVRTFFEKSHTISEIEKGLRVKKEEKFSGALIIGT